MKKMNGIKARLANAREICPGMDDDFYAVVSCVEKYTTEENTPGGLIMVVEQVMDALARVSEKSNLYATITLDSLKAERMWNELMLFPLMVDAMEAAETRKAQSKSWTKEMMNAAKR